MNTALKEIEQIRQARHAKFQRMYDEAVLADLKAEGIKKNHPVWIRVSEKVVKRKYQ
jgi:hypothetical protein